MKPSCTLIVLVTLIASAFLLAGSMPAASLGSELSPLGTGEIVLVAEDLMDLKWAPSSYPGASQTFMRWELYRGTSPTSPALVASGVDINTDFYRDTGLSVGPTYYYRLDIVRCVAPCHGAPDERRYTVFSDSAKSGLFQGTVLKSLSLIPTTPAVYEIGFADMGSGAVVNVVNGATLTLMGTQAELRVTHAAAITQGSLAVNGGHLKIDRVVLDGVSLTYGDSNNAASAADGWVRDSRLTGVPILLTGRANVEVQRNTGGFYIYANCQSSLTARRNVMDGVINLEGHATATIEENTLSNVGVSVSGFEPNTNCWTVPVPKANALIVGNVITTSSVSLGLVNVTEGGQATVSNNRLEYTQFHGTESALLLDAALVGTRLTAQGNTIVGGKVVVTHGATVTLTENLISGGGSAIAIAFRYSNSIQSTGRIERNTIQNGWGLELWDGSTGVSIRHNCIRGNNPGATVDDAGLTQSVDLLYNWWGHDSGPQHPTNPGGRGDPISGNKVLFDPWDQTDANCLNSAPPVYPDFRFAGMEAVQVVQSLENTVPLVAGKPTIVRAYPESRVGTVPAVPWRMRAYRNGALLDQKEGTITLAPITDMDWTRDNKHAGLSFKLDPTWLTGTVQIAVELNPNHTLSETSLANNLISQTLVFQDRAPLRVMIVPIAYQPNGVGPITRPDLNQVPSMKKDLQNLFPISRADFRVTAALPFTLPMRTVPTDTEVLNGNKVLDALNYRLLFWNANHPPAAQYDQIAGLFPWGIIRLCTSDPRWSKDLGSSHLGLASYCTSDAPIQAHEIGHNLGLRHPNRSDSCDASDAQSYWPSIYPDSTIQEHGYDLLNDQTMDKTTKDLMTYCSPKWLSPLHYSMLYLANSAPQANAATELAAQTYLVVGGRVDTLGQVSFNPFWQISAETAPAAPPTGASYCLELQNASGTVLVSRCFNLTFYNYEFNAPTQSESFLVALPYDASTQAAATRLVLRQGAAVLKQVAASAHAPTVTLQYPNGGETLSDTVSVRWTASDLDGDPLTYNLLYSRDNGLTWEPLAMNLATTSPYTLDLQLAAGTSSARLRIEASDGFRSASDVSDATFTVTDKAPLVVIDVPADGVTVVASAYLRGYAYDLEEGELSGSFLVWTSDRDGVLGTGNDLSGLGLSEGQHTLTLTATDSKGHTSSASVTVKVVKAFLISLPLVAK